MEALSLKGRKAEKIAVTSAEKRVGTFFNSSSECYLTMTKNLPILVGFEK
jgi:hypothetical protein